MSALTADVIVDRVRSICASVPFEFIETDWDTFDRQPATNIDAVFRIPPPKSGTTIGGFAYAEDRTDVLQIWVARKHNQNFVDVRQTLIRDVHSLTAAIVRDGTSTLGDYSVPDDDRSHEFGIDDGSEYVTLALTLPINYDAQL